MGTTVLGSDFYYGYYGITIASFSGVFLTASANLSDVASVSNSRSNLDVPAFADIYTRAQLQIDGSAFVHWGNIINDVWTKPAANIVAGYNVDINLHDITNVSTMYSTDITNSDVLTSASILVSQWDSGQNGSIVTVNSSTGQLDRLQTIYLDPNGSTFNVEHDANFTKHVTIGDSISDVLTINSNVNANIVSVSFNSGYAFISVMTNDTFVDNIASYNKHRSSSIGAVATPLVVAHESTDQGALSTGFGAGILFKGDIYPPVDTSVAFAQISAILDTTTYLEFKAGSSGTLSSVLEVDYDEVRILEKLIVNSVNSGENYIYNFQVDITHIVSRTGSTSTVIDSLVVKTESNSSPGDGFGTSILFRVGQVTPTETDIARISARFTGGTTNSEIVLAPMVSEVAQENLVIGVTEINFATDIIPTDTETYDLGSSGKRIDTVYTNWFRLGTAAGGDKMIFNTASASFDTHVLPLTDATYQLGDETSALRWAEMHSIEVHVGGAISSSRSAGLTAKQNVASGFYAAVFESNSGENDDENGILIRSGSAVALAGEDVFIVFEDLGGSIVGGVRRNVGNTAFEFFEGEPWG